MNKISFHKKVRTLLNLKFLNFKLNENIVWLDDISVYEKFYREFKNFKIYHYYEWKYNGMPDKDIILLPSKFISHDEMKEVIDKEGSFIVYME